LPEEQPRGRGEEPSAEVPEEGEWLAVAAAARRLGVSPRAIRSRIERGTLRWRAAGNTGKLVWLPSGGPSSGGAGGAFQGPSPGEEADLLGDEVDELERLRDELGDTREKLTAALVAAARAEERADALQTGLAREQAAMGRLVDAMRQALDHERTRADRLEAELRKPWWRRLLG
jgi:hypothetical protein